MCPFVDSDVPAGGTADAPVFGSSHGILDNRNLDHHLTSDDFGDVNCVDGEAASVGVMVARVLRALGRVARSAGHGQVHVSSQRR